MEKLEFLDQRVFKDLKNENTEFDKNPIHYFSEADFETVLKRAAYLGIGIYTIEAFLDNKSFASYSHEDRHKKATDSKWFTRVFLTLKTRQEGLLYAATYKVSAKLLLREGDLTIKEEEE